MYRWVGSLGCILPLTPSVWELHPPYQHEAWLTAYECKIIWSRWAHLAMVVTIWSKISFLRRVCKSFHSMIYSLFQLFWDSVCWGDYREKWKHMTYVVPAFAIVLPYLFFFRRPILGCEHVEVGISYIQGNHESSLERRSIFGQKVTLLIRKVFVVTCCWQYRSSILSHSFPPTCFAISEWCKK